MFQNIANCMLVCLLVWPATSVNAATPDKHAVSHDVLPVPSAMARSCRQALDERTHVELRDTPLEDAIRFFADFHEISIQIDTQVLQEEGMALDSEISANFADVSLKEGLRLLLEPHGLTFLIVDDCLLITTRQAADNHLVLRTYPIGDLATSHEEMESLVEVIRIGSGDDGWEERSPTRKIISVPSIRALVVWQSYEMHERVRDVLMNLRQAKTVEETGEWPAEKHPPAADTEAVKKVRKPKK